MDKMDVARRQLGTGLHLFIHDADPVSVHTLASAGCEIAEHLSVRSGGTPFVRHALATFPDMDMPTLRNIQRKHSNAFKHAATHTGKERDDGTLLQSFTDQQNDGALFVGWYDYVQASGNLPIAAQVFQVWFFALHPDKLAPHVDAEPYDLIFPLLTQASRQQQKQRLREMVARYEKDQDLLKDEKTDPRPLMLAL